MCQTYPRPAGLPAGGFDPAPHFAASGKAPLSSESQSSVHLIFDKYRVFLRVSCRVPNLLILLQALLFHTEAFDVPWGREALRRSTMNAACL